MKILISDLLDGYEENELSLPAASRVTNAAITRRTMKKLDAQRRHRPAALVLIAAALIALFCGASAVVHIVTLNKTTPREETVVIGARNDDGTFTPEAITVKAPDGTTSARFDGAAAVDNPMLVGFRAGWLPDSVGEPFISSLRDQMNWDNITIPEGSSLTEGDLVSIDIYHASRVSEAYERASPQSGRSYSINAYSATSVADADVILLGSNAETVKTGIIGQFQATWVSMHYDSGEVSLNALLLFDEASGGAVTISGGLQFEVYEKIAENLELIVTDIPAVDTGRTFQFSGALG